MRCPNCNSPVDKDAEFCERCGIKLSNYKKTSRLPAVIISGVVFIAAVGGLFFWVVSDEYHKVGETELDELVEKAAPSDEEGKTEEKESTDSSNNSGNTDNGDRVKDGEEESQQSETETVYDVTEGGIHRYNYVVSDCTWEEAYQNCLEAGGYLVRINSLDEYNYIIDQIDQKHMSDIQFKIGGRRAEGAQDYYWVNESKQLYGEKVNSDSYWTKEIWLSGEPSYSDGNVQENYLDIFYYGTEDRWVLNDVPDDILSSAPEFSGKLGYICEYEN